MSAVTQSLWLPYTRSSFFSLSEGSWLDMKLTATDSAAHCRSSRIDREDYVPLVHVDVLRRLLEVLPRSFGYSPVGVCRLRGPSERNPYPVDVTLALDLTRLPSEPTVKDFWHEANDGLVATGVAGVRLFADENGWYAFTAEHRPGADEDRVRAALIQHIRQIFGGDFVVHPLQGSRRRGAVGANSLKGYSGLSGDSPEARISQPLGAMSFAQLNVVAEGLWNDTLLPAVYLEQYDFMSRYLATEESSEFLRSLADVVEALTTDADANATIGKIEALDRFLTISAGTSLLKLQSSIDSSHRRLLDDALAAHRQTRLVQLQFANNARERRPEYAVGATDSQLRGYLKLVLAKFPLFTAVADMVKRAEDHLTWLVDNDLSESGLQDNSQASDRLQKLDRQSTEWRGLIEQLTRSIQRVEQAAELAWQDALLFEEQQARADQEALAEIEQSRLNRSTRTAGRLSYGLLTLIVAILGVVFAFGPVGVGPDIKSMGITSPLGWSLWSFGLIALIIGAVVLILGFFVRDVLRERSGRQDLRTYVLSVRLDERVDPAMLTRYLHNTKRRKLGRGSARMARPKAWAVNDGLSRVDLISTETQIVKPQTVVTFRTAWLRYSRFEVTNDIVMQRVNGQVYYVLVSCRIVGQSWNRIPPFQLLELRNAILYDALVQFAPDGAESEITYVIAEALPLAEREAGDTLRHPSP